MMPTLKKYAAPLVAGTVLIGGAIGSALQPAPITLDTTTASEVIWNKPTTDAQWAEDVKRENFDIKSDKALNELRDAQTIKLAEEKKAFVEYQDCSECIYYEKYQGFLANGMDDATAQSEAHKAAATDTAQRSWEIEKIEQSIERITHELDLRARGVVITDHTATGKKRSASALAGKTVRVIHD